MKAITVEVMDAILNDPSGDQLSLRFQQQRATVAGTIQALMATAVANILAEACCLGQREQVEYIINCFEILLADVRAGITAAEKVIAEAANGPA